MLGELCELYGVPLDERQITVLEAFVRRLMNASFNLTALRDERSALIKHVIEVLLPLRGVEIKGEIVDVGSGGGVPAVPLAVRYGRAVRVWALESVTKKARFIREIAKALNLRLEVLSGRAEELGRGEFRERFDAAFSRALGPLPVALELMAPLTKVGGRLYLYSGRSAREELSSAQKALDELGLELGDVVDYEVEGKEFLLLVFEKLRSTPQRYPRRFAAIKRKPLVNR